MSELQKIAIFGGTFDPVHLGHLQMAVAAQAEFALDEVRYVPCRISPHKSHTCPAPATDRLEMLRLATTSQPWARVDNVEIQRDGASFSYQTAEEIQARAPTARLFWIMGGDQWDALSSWAKPERLAACVEFIVFSRGNTPTPRPGFTLHALKNTHPASATEIRHSLDCGEKCHPWLHPAVFSYIRGHHLYKG